MTYRILRLSLFALLCAVFTATLPSAAVAFDLFGLKIFEDQSAEDASAIIADPQAYEVNIDIAGDDTEVIDAARNTSTLWAGRDAPASGAAGLLASARTDYRRIVAALYANGYYGGTVTINVDGTEATNLAPDASLGDPALVVIRVDPGPQFTFGTIKIVNAAPLTTNNTDQVDSVESAGLLKGEIARSGAVRTAARLAVNSWRQQGYPKAEITDQNIIADHDVALVNVTLTITPGPKATIGTISVEGASAVDAAFIARHTGLVAGKEYDPDDIGRAKRRLADLEVFGVIKVVEADKVNADGSLPINIIVNERKPRRVGVGATYSTTDGAGLETFWLHRNLFGNAERLRLDARLAGIGYPLQSADFDYYFGGTFTKPSIITPETDLVAALVAQRTVLEQYTETSLEAKLGLAHQFSTEFSVDFGVGAKRADFYDDTFGQRDFTLIGAYGELTFDTRDDPSNATSGVYATFLAEPFYEAEYENSALLLITEGRGYFGLGPNNEVVLAGRIKAGALFGPTIAETPPDKLFFAGGGGSVRGYSFRSIGVEEPGGTVTGGTYLLEASVEARVKVTKDIGVVGFVDAGYVTDETLVSLSDGLRLGAGVGLRYETGLGPLRLDFAVPINKRPGDPDYAIYVGIGQAF